MSNLFDDLNEKIKKIKSFDDFEQLKQSILDDIHKLKQRDIIKDFQLKKYLKDKNIINSLLIKTSSDLQKVLSELQMRADELDILLNTIPAFVFFKDLEYRYVLVNKSFTNFIDLPESKIIGKTLQNLTFSHLLLKSYSKHEKKVLEQGVEEYNITEKLEKNNKTLWLNTNLAPVKNSQGEIIGLVGISWDVTSNKIYEAELKKAKVLAEEGTKTKSQFLANMSHEIRTPLNGIIGMAQILNETRLTKKQKEIVNILSTSGENLLVLINDILDFSKIEAGKINFINKDFRLDKPVKEIYDILSRRAEEKGLLLYVNIDKNIPAYVNGDEYRFKQVVLNLVNNAIKFTEKGHVKISVENIGIKEGLHTIKVSVEDTGIGIPEAKKKELFKSFSQLDPSSTKQYEGTGLGLAISKLLTNMMKGEIGVESKPGRGSTFWFTAGFKEGTPPQNIKKDLVVAQSKKLKSKTIRVLVVEDNLINQKISSFSLKKAGMEVTLANNGQEAVELFKKQSFDVILMDIQMPVMDGYEATREIRKIEKSLNTYTPIIALTANAMQGDAEKCIAAGMDNYLSKPFKIDKLIGILNEIVN
jgi:PAS domain S-box-containing protein